MARRRAHRKRPNASAPCYADKAARTGLRVATCSTFDPARAYARGPGERRAPPSGHKEKLPISRAVDRYNIARRGLRRRGRHGAGSSRAYRHGKAVCSRVRKERSSTSTGDVPVRHSRTPDRPDLRGARSPPGSSTDPRIAKAYCTRVGEGPFPTELKNAIAIDPRGRHEYGATTGRHVLRLVRRRAVPTPEIRARTMDRPISNPDRVREIVHGRRWPWPIAVDRPSDPMRHGGRDPSRTRQDVEIREIHRPPRSRGRSGRHGVRTSRSDVTTRPSARIRVGPRDPIADRVFSSVGRVLADARAVSLAIPRLVECAAGTTRRRRSVGPVFEEVTNVRPGRCRGALLAHLDRTACLA